MNNQITVDIPINKSIGLNSKVAFLGSCFSDNISSKFLVNNLPCLGNPFGTVFNPISLSEIICSAIKCDSLDDSVFQNEDVFLNWKFNSKVFGLSNKDLINRVVDLQSELRSFLQNSSHLVLTLGTAHVYRLIQDFSVVSSCHKMDKSLFKKDLLSIDELNLSLSPALDLIRDINPNIKILFTISPVRYKRDGLTESFISKSRLREAVFHFCDTYNTEYFPSYEIVTDELRDYRYFEEDGVHPNSKAIDHVWGRFKETFFDDGLIEYLDRLKKLKSRVNHIHLHPGSNKAKGFDEKTQEAIAEFNFDYPDNPFK